MQTNTLFYTILPQSGQWSCKFTAVTIAFPAHNKLYLPYDKTLLTEGFIVWCRLVDSNYRPTHYECVALPTELNRQRFTFYHAFLFLQALLCIFFNFSSGIELFFRRNLFALMDNHLLERDFNALLNKASVHRS